MRDYTISPEAKAQRLARQLLRKSQPDDPLAERVKKIEFWRKCAETNRGYLPHNGAWWWTFTMQPGFRHLLMPKLRAMITAREKACRDQHAAKMRESAQRFAQIKAERTAEKARAKTPQMELLT